MRRSGWLTAWTRRNLARQNYVSAPARAAGLYCSAGDDPLSRYGREVMPRSLFLILVVWPLLAAGGPSAEPGEEDAAAKDLAQLQGKWKFVAEDRDGTVRKFRDGEGHVITIRGEFQFWHDADGKLATKESLKLDPSKSPKTIDMTIVFNRLYPNAKGLTARGIYQLEGDELKIATPAELFYGRPKEFTTKKGSHFIVSTYKRVKP
jgi:uncharacterized protein (TIGR03067 family)